MITIKDEEIAKLELIRHGSNCIGLFMSLGNERYKLLDVTKSGIWLRSVPSDFLARCGMEGGREVAVRDSKGRVIKSVAP